MLIKGPGTRARVRKQCADSSFEGEDGQMLLIVWVSLEQRLVKLVAEASYRSAGIFSSVTKTSRTARSSAACAGDSTACSCCTSLANDTANHTD